MTLAPSILSIIGMFLIQQYTGTDIGYNMRHVQFTSRDGFWFFLTVDVIGSIFVVCSIVVVGVAARGVVGSTAAVAIAKAAVAVLSIVVVIGSWTLPPRVIVACGFHVTVIVAMPMVV
eukprot:scaffold5932_cov96-Skeletonema_dohrnii-CCMP3373.AAC.1